MIRSVAAFWVTVLSWAASASVLAIAPPAKDGIPDTLKAADFDRNGFVNGEDADSFRRAFEAGQISADFDGNGFVTGEDFDAFTHAFQRGSSVATLTMESATLLSSGFDVLIVWRASAPAQYETVDWKDGYIAGKWFDIPGQTSMRHAGTCKFIAADGTLEWQTRIRLGTPIVYGTASKTISIDVGLLADKHGNTNAAVSAGTLDVTRTLVDSTGFLDETITPGSGGVTLYVDPVNGNDTRTLAQAQSTSTPLKTINKAQDLLINNALDDKGCHIKVFEGQADSRTQSGSAVNLRCKGPTPNKPFLITVCSNTGGTATGRALIRLDNGGTLGASLIGIVHDWNGGADYPNVCINGFDIAVTDTSSTCTGAALDVTGFMSNFSMIDCRLQRNRSGVSFQSRAAFGTIHRCIIVDTGGINQGTWGDSSGVFIDYVPKGMVFSDLAIDRCGKSEPTLVGGTNRSRNIYMGKYGTTIDDPVSGIPTGPTMLVNSWMLRGQDTTVQMRSGGMSGVVFHKCPGAGFVGGPGCSGANMIAQLEAGDFVETDLSLTPCSQGVYINNSIRDYNNQLSDNECAKSGIIEAIVMYPEVGTAAFRGRAPGVMGSNYTEKHEYIMRKVSVKGVGPVFINSETAYLLGSVKMSSVLIDSRGANNQLALYFENDYAGVGYGFINRSKNVYINDNASALAYVSGANKSLTQYKAIVGTDADAMSTTAIYPFPTRSLSSWAALNGLTDEAGFYTAIRDRPYRTWNAAFDAYAAVEYFQAGLDALGSTWLNDAAGTTVGIPTERLTEDSPTPPASRRNQLRGRNRPGL